MLEKWRQIVDDHVWCDGFSTGSQSCQIHWSEDDDRIHLSASLISIHLATLIHFISKKDPHRRD